METVYSAHVAEFYYHKAMRAEQHYFSGTISLYRKLYYHLALMFAKQADAEEHGIWASAH